MSKRIEFLSNPVDAEPLFAEALAMIVSSNYTAEEAKLVAHQALYQNSLARNRERLLNQWTEAYSEDYEKWKSCAKVLEDNIAQLVDAACRLDEDSIAHNILNKNIIRMREGVNELDRIHRNFLHSMVSSIGADEALEIRKTVE